MDIDPSEEGRTGGERKSEEAQQRQTAMRRDSEVVHAAFQDLGVALGTSRAKWCEMHGLPRLDGDRDIVAFSQCAKRYLIAEVEGISSGQPEQKLYKAIGQIVLAASCNPLDGWSRDLCIVVHGEEIARHLRRATALQNLRVSAFHVGDSPATDECLFGSFPL